MFFVAKTQFAKLSFYSGGVERIFQSYCTFLMMTVSSPTLYSLLDDCTAYSEKGS